MKQDEIIRVGVGAVVFRGDQVLLVKRGKPPFLGHWSIPGGGLEFGERLEDGVIREVREETTCEIRLIGLINVFEAMARIEEGQALPQTVMIDYAAAWVSGEPVAGDDAAEAEFVPFNDALARLEWDQTRRALREALALRDGAKFA